MMDTIKSYFHELIYDDAPVRIKISSFAKLLSMFSFILILFLTYNYMDKLKTIENYYVYIMFSIIVIPTSIHLFVLKIMGHLYKKDEVGFTKVINIISNICEILFGIIVLVLLLLESKEIIETGKELDNLSSSYDLLFILWGFLIIYFIVIIIRMVVRKRNGKK